MVVRIVGYRSWSVKEIEFIHKNFLRMSYEEMGRVLGRPLSTVRYKANDIGLRRGKPKKWTDEEIDFLMEHYSSASMSSKEIGASIGRSIYAVRAKARKLGIKKGKREPEVKKVADRKCLKALRMKLSENMDICRSCVAEWDVPPGCDRDSYRHRLEHQRCPRCAIQIKNREIVEEIEVIQRSIRVEMEMAEARKWRGIRGE